MGSATALTSLDGKATGEGATVDFAGAVSRVSMLVTVTGTVTDGKVRMQASHDGTNWATLRTAYPTTGVNVTCDHSEGAYRYWRAVVDSAIKGGGTVTTTFMEAG